ncbi:MAG: rod shape-determining protein MreC [Negativicutes bacterium]|nr:rod shape-determining protein MreC [Negativicutes bacterium]MBP8628626.1 rod shape-determining protein MreC [Negativicutes bacterium]MBP9536771.1 rod shape-determining protein MreC [Negativicutes bacterium]
MRRRVRVDASNRRTIILWVAVFIVGLLAFTTVKGKYDLKISENVVNTILSPFQSAITSISNVTKKIGVISWEMVTVYEQNKMLRSEVEQLRQRDVNVNEIMAENTRLTNILNYKNAVKQFDTAVAKIISYDSSNLTNSITINLGAKDGMQKNMPVITPQGLVGTIVAVYEHSAKVQLILDPRSAVGAIIQRPESRVIGIMQGSVGVQTLAKMLNIPRDADVVVGDNVLTSGYGGLYPKGIVIGEVVEVTNEAGGLLKYATVKTAVDFYRIEEVLVIVNSRETAPAPLNAVIPPSANKGVAK